MTSSGGLKITRGGWDFCSGSWLGDSAPLESRGGRRVVRSSRSRARVLGYFDRSSVGANYHQLLSLPHVGKGGITCMGLTNNVITVSGCRARLVRTGVLVSYFHVQAKQLTHRG
jgi:hypothetical protein